GFVLRNNDSAKKHVVNYFANTAKGIDPNIVRQMIDAASRHGAGLIASIISTGLIIYAALGFFETLQASLDTVWEVRARSDLTWRRMLRKRGLSLLLVMVIGALVLISVAATTLLTG